MKVLKDPKNQPCCTIEESGLEGFNTDTANDFALGFLKNIGDVFSGGAVSKNSDPFSNVKEKIEAMKSSYQNMFADSVRSSIKTLSKHASDTTKEIVTNLNTVKNNIDQNLDNMNFILTTEIDTNLNSIFIINIILLVIILFLLFK